MFEKLCEIYVANRLEQHPRWPEDYKYFEKDFMVKICYHIGSNALKDLQREYKISF